MINILLFSIVVVTGLIAYFSYLGYKNDNGGYFRAAAALFVVLIFIIITSNINENNKRSSRTEACTCRCIHGTEADTQD